MLFFAKRLLGIGLILEESTKCAPCALHYVAILFLPCQTLPNHPHFENDASETAIGTKLTQEHVPVHKAITFLSKTLSSSSEQNYSFYDCKLLIIITCWKAWHPILMGNEL